MQRSVFSALVFVGILLGSVSAAQAYDPLCDKIKKPITRDRCICNSDAGGKVRERPNDRGRMVVSWTRPSRQAPQVHSCMVVKGHKTI